MFNKICVSLKIGTFEICNLSELAIKAQQWRICAINYLTHHDPDKCRRYHQSVNFM
jgi:hypothetical protein